MKKIYFPILFLFIASLTFYSCERESVEQPVSQSDFYDNLTGADYLDYYSTPDVFFNMAKVNEESEVIRGWFVDKTGTIYIYETTLEEFPVIDPIINKNRLAELQEIAQASDTKIDLDELVEYYKKTRNAANGDFDLVDENAPATISVYFNAYDLQLGNGACLNCPVSQVSRDENAQLVLKAEGSLIGQIDVPSARSIVAWMNDIDLGL